MTETTLSTEETRLADRSDWVSDNFSDNNLTAMFNTPDFHHRSASPDPPYIQAPREAINTISPKEVARLLTNLPTISQMSQVPTAAAFRLRMSTETESQRVAHFHDQLDALTAPDSASLVGRILDKGFVSTQELYTWIKGPEDLRGILRISRARFLKETSKGYRPEPAAARLADQIIRASET